MDFRAPSGTAGYEASALARRTAPLASACARAGSIGAAGRVPRGGAVGVHHRAFPVARRRGRLGARSGGGRVLAAHQRVAVDVALCGCGGAADSGLLSARAHAAPAAPGATVRAPAPTTLSRAHTGCVCAQVRVGKQPLDGGGGELRRDALDGAEQRPGGCGGGRAGRVRAAARAVPRGRDGAGSSVPRWPARHSGCAFSWRPSALRAHFTVRGACAAGHGADGHLRAAGRARRAGLQHRQPAAAARAVRHHARLALAHHAVLLPARGCAQVPQVLSWRSVRPFPTHM